MKVLSNLTVRTITRLLVLASLFCIINSTNGQTTGKSLAFDGVNDYIDLGGDNNFGTVSNFQGDFTFEAWVLNDGSNSWARVFDFGDSQNDYIIFTVKSGDNSQCRFEYRTGGGVKYKLDGGIFPTGWTHVACRLPASGEASIILTPASTGVSQEYGTTGWPPISNIVGTTKNYLGKSIFADPYFKGKMKEVRVWKEYRSAALLDEWRNCEISGDESTLIGYYKMNQGIVGANNSTSDQFCNNYGKLSDEPGSLENFDLSGTVSNWSSDAPSSFDDSAVNRNAIELYGPQDFITLNNEANFDFDRELTIQYWCNTNFSNSLDQVNFVKGKLDGTGSPALTFYTYHNANYIDFGVRDANNNQYFVRSHNMPTNKWIHISHTAKVFAGQLTLKTYYDGVEVSSNLFGNFFNLPQTDEKVVIGATGFSGKLANIKFWDRTLEGFEISENYNTIHEVETPNLVAQYSDYSNNLLLELTDDIGGNNGVRTGVPAFITDPCFVTFAAEPQDFQMPNFGATIDLSADINNCNNTYHSYQWQKDGIDIPGATSLDLSISNVSTADLGVYQLIVTACGQSFPTRGALVTIANQGKVLHFDGIDDYVSFSDNTGNNGYTVEARIRFDEDPVNQSIIVNTDLDESLITGQLVVNEDGYLQHNMWHPTLKEMRFSTHPLKINAHTWYNVEIHYDMTNLWIEVNDITILKTYSPGNSAVLPLWYIGKSIATYDAFKGEIDEVRVWNSNVATIVAQPTVSASPNLVDYYQFNEGIAESDNITPILLNVVADPYSGSVATLHNFDLIGSQSNWLGCDRYDNDVIINMPVDQKVTVGNQLTLAATVNNPDGTETYQWYKDGLAIDGATNSTYQTNTTLADEGSYQLEVGQFNSCNTFGDVTEVFIKGTGEVLHFDGINDHLVIPSSFYQTSYTVEVWIKFDDSVSNQNIIVATSSDAPKVAQGIQLYTDDDGYLVHSNYLTSSNTFVNIKSLAPVQANTWYHVALRSVSNAVGMHLFLDGVLQGQIATNSQFWTGQDNWHVGSSVITDEVGVKSLKNNFRGQMDELRIWSGYISDSRIQNERDNELDNSNSFHLLQHYLKFNQGKALENNAGSINTGSIPNFKNLDSSVPVSTDAKYVNFDFTGDKSNFLNCSPITKPELEYTLGGTSGLGLSIGQSLEIDLGIETGDTSQLLFQWLLDDQVIEGANEPLYSIESMTEDDFGTYKVAIEDMCSPVFYDTIIVPYIPTTNTCYTNYSNPTNYPDSTRYVFCNGYEGENNLCFEPRELGGFKTDYGYCDTEILYEGEEIVFHISLTEPQVVDLTLQNIQADVDMWVFGDDCDLDNCLASSLELGLQDEFIRVALPAGDFYVLIDEKEYFEFTAGNDSLVLDVQMYDNKCSFAQPIACDDEVSGMTTNGSNFIDNYDEFTGYTATEQVYELTITDPVTINATLSGLSSDLDLFLLDSTCIENNLLISSRQVDSSDDMISYGLQPGTYYIIVDGKDGASGSFNLSVTCANYFDASVDETDAYIDLNWSIDKKACVPQDTGIIVRLITTPNTILFEEEYTTAALTPDVITGTFRDIVGDDHTRMYVLRVYNRLSNETLCNEVKTGSTLPFQQPEIISISQAEAADSIQLVFRNHSQLSEEFRIFRDGMQVASLSEGYTEDSLIVAYVDYHNMDNDTTSIEEASSYNYCIETRSVSLAMSYAQVCGSGTTTDVNFAASDGGTGDMVSMTWNDISMYADAIIIKRNGIQIQSISANETFYNDMSPIYGVTSEYSLTYLRDGDEKLTVTDNGYTEPNGLVAGRLVTEEGGFPVPGATVTLSRDSIVQGQVESFDIFITQSDIEGKFSIPDVVYKLSSNFNVTATRDGSDFAPEIISFELNSAFPEKTDLLFTDNQDIIVTPVTLLDTLTADEREPQDLVVIDWDYTYDAGIVTSFTLKRNGELIFEGNDTAGKLDSFVDRTGVPGFSYVYALEAFTYASGVDINSEIREVSATYPELSPVTSFEVTFDSQTQNNTGELVDPKVIFNWSNIPFLSENFDGFRVFRNNILIGEVGPNDNRDYAFIAPPEEEAYFTIRTYKKINGATYESASSAIDTFTALPLWKPGVVTTDPFAFPPTDRAIVVDLDIMNTFGEFYEAAVFTGVNVSRKEQGAPDEEYTEIGDLTKQFIVTNSDAQTTVQVWDALGIPNQNYTYKISTYLDLNGNRYTRDTIFERVCPEIVAPTNLQKTEEVGRVGLTWTDNSITQGNVSQLYFNYSGYELLRRDITNGGSSDLIATLPGSIERFDDFLSNPVFNLFLDDYVTTDYEYTLRAYFDIDSSRYYSQALSIDAKPLNGGTNEPLPVNFTASKDIPGHIKLCWEWNAAKQSEFIIYRDTVAIDTLPPTARAYYDYDAPSDPTVLYKITSLFNSNESEYVLAEGRLPSNMRIEGRISNVTTGAGLEGVNVRYRNQSEFNGIAEGVYQGSTLTDATGSYYFDDIPHTPGLQYQINIFSNNADFAVSETEFFSFGQEHVDITSDREYKVDFLEYSEYDPSNVVTSIAGVNAISHADSMFVEVTWSPEHEYYDGFQVFRENQLIQEVRKGDGFTYKDRSGFAGIGYVYSVRAYKSEIEGRVFSAKVGAAAVFPAILPVENLTVTAFADMNLMLVQWSHPLDNHDFYRIRRNNEFMAAIPAGSPMMWYDSTGIPGVEYQYEVSAINNPNISLPVSLTKTYKGVGEAKNLSVEVNGFVPACTGTLTNDNHVSIRWEYAPDAAQGFEIYRDGQLIAEIDDQSLAFGDLPVAVGDTLMTGNVAIYDDYSGLPGINHTYHVLPYVERDGDRYTSGIEELFLQESIVYPQLAEVSGLDVAQNNVLGSAEINFTYDQFVVDGFQILRDGVVIDTVLSSIDTEGVSDYTAQDFTGLPGQVYTYSVRAFDRRIGVTYFGSVLCEETITYPIVPTPQDFTASQGTFENHVEIDWAFSTEAFVDSFYLENITLGVVEVFSTGKRRFIDVVNDFSDDKYQYRMRASRINEGQTTYSQWTDVRDGWCARQITGDEDEVLEGNILIGRNGYSTDIDGDWAVSGAINGTESILIYRRVNGGWSLYQTITSPELLETFPNLNIDFGHAVAISGNTIVVGAPKFETNGAVYVYELEGDIWSDRPVVLQSGTVTNFGWSVDIDNDDIIIGNPTVSSFGVVHWYKRQSDGLWTPNGSVAGNTAVSSGGVQRFGYGVAIDAGFSAVSYNDIAANYSEVVGYVKDSNGDWASNGPFNTDRYDYIGFVGQDNIDYNDETLVIGDRAYSGSIGRIKVVELENNIKVSSLEYVGTHGTNSTFGFSVAVQKIASPVDDAIYVAVGSPFTTQNGTVNGGRATLLSNVNGTFEVIDEVVNSDESIDELAGWSVALSKDAWGVGTIQDGPLNKGSLVLGNLLIAPNKANATDGISADFDPDKTTISWEFDGNFDMLAGFNIYRDEEFLTYRDKATMTVIAPGVYADAWDDNSGNAGQPYIYAVKSVNNLVPFESYGTSEEGYNSSNGVLQGSVKTQLGLVPIPNVNITATGIVDGEVFTYKTQTLSNGQYLFNDVYYDSADGSITEYEVIGEFLDHVIIPQTTNIALFNPLSDPTQAVVDFFDVTAYVVKGTVAQPDISCPLEGIKITLIQDGVALVGQEAYTDAEGNYSLVIDPFVENLQELRIRIDQSLDVEQVVTTYNFQPDADTIITDFTSLPIITEINFNDELTYDIDLRVKNTCNDPISTGKWDVRIRTLDGCFDEVYQTSSTGNLTVPLIPQNYRMQVVGVDVPTATNQQALDYYANFPMSLNLLNTHIDSIETLTKMEIEEMSERQFTFHKAANIEVSGLDNIICNTQTAALSQQETYTLNLNVFEVFDGSQCSVEEGLIEITNPASTDDGPVIVRYDKVTESFPTYTFTAGNPNPVFPHAFAITFDYKSDDGIFLGRKIRAAFVEGSIAIPGTDIIVDPASGNDAVPYPLMVLRDPPGDQSSSYIAAGQTINFETEMTVENSFDGSLYTELETEVFSIGVDLNTSINGGYTKEQSIVLSNEITTSVTISTSDDEDNIGRGADVIVGTGLVTQFGTIREFRVGECDEIIVEKKIGISPNAATTTWSYQISQVEEIIQGFINDSLRLEADMLTISRNGEELTTQDARVFLNSNISNWKEVLLYHDVKTVPYYVLCTLKPSELISANHITQLGYWQAQIKPFFGDDVNGEFVLKDEIIWDQQLINIYNAASAAIRNIQQGGDLNIWSFPYTGDQNDVDLSIPGVGFDLVDLGSVLSNPGLIDYTAQFGDQVKNITTGGNITIEESIENVSASETTMNQSIYLGTELDIAGSIGGDVTLETGGFAGLGAGVIFGKVTEVTSTEFTVGVTIETQATRSNNFTSSIEEAVEVGYTIFDDDNIDAFSFAVIQGVAPNMTPYFDYFGGHSSCPPEDGSVFVDDPAMVIVKDIVTGAGGPTHSLFNVPADEAATFIIRADNQSPIASEPTRELKLFLESSSNPNGAIVKLNGVSLNNAEYVDSFAVGDFQDLTLTIERGPTEYDYPDIQIGFEPTCGEGPREYVYASAYFVNPCSPVTIVSPIENWVINDDTTKLVITMQDYDPTNPFLVDATAQYRRIGSGSDWTDIPAQELEQGNFIIADSLAANDEDYAEGQIEKYFFIWSIPTTEGTYPDGDYEVRTKMVCSNFSATISNVISGKIARDGLNLFGNPQPADQIWTEGDEISFTFNKDLDCALINQSFINSNISVYNETTGLDVPFTLSCYANKLIFVMDDPMSVYDGQFLTINIDNIASIEGNISQPHSWTFRVVTQQLYWADADTVRISMYRDDIQNLTVNLENSGTIEVSDLDLEAADGVFDDWLTITNPITPPLFTVNPAGRAITMEIDASLPEDVYNETINVVGPGVLGSTPQVHIQLKVLVKPPNWTVDPGDFQTNMNLIANWNYTTDDPDVISTDITDLISVWVGNEIRGVAPITESGEFYASYLTVYGRPDDGTDTPLEFRIWDADLGIEYDGQPTDTIFFVDGTIRGTTANPEILTVDAEYDRARYIPLRQGWTGFSLPHITTDMSVKHKLRTLANLTDGDLIVTGDKFSQYTDSTGWFNFGASNLTSISNHEGYMIYLDAGPDTLRVTGSAATPIDLQLKSGWNWIGFPFENVEDINDVLEFNAANTTPNDRIKLDFPLPGGTTKFANYDFITNWTDGTLDNMEPNNLYKLYSGNPNGANLTWMPENNAKGEEIDDLARSSAIVDPNDPLTWVLPDLADDAIMPVIAEVLVGGVAASDPADMVAFFENDTIRALGSIEYIDALMVYEVSMLAESTSGSYDIRYYDASEGTVSQATNQLSFDINGVGDVLNPYEIVFEANPCSDMLIIGPTGTPFALDKTFEARQEIRVTGNLNIPAGVNIILSAPKVTIVDLLNAGDGANIIVRPDGCE